MDKGILTAKDFMCLTCIIAPPLQKVFRPIEDHVSNGVNTFIFRKISCFVPRCLVHLKNVHKNPITLVM